MNVTIIPTEGCYQKTRVGEVVKDLKTIWVVKVPGEMCNWKFSKKDHLRTGYFKKQFPRYMIRFNDA